MYNMVFDNYKEITFEDSLKMFHEFSVKSQDYDHLPPTVAEDKDFGSDFPGSLIQKIRYNGCRFYGSQFVASNGAFSILKNVYFYDCYFEDANMNYCSFEECHFISTNGFFVSGTGFNFSKFSNCHFKGIDFRGVAFRDVYMDGCTFENCNINNSSFERAIIKNSSFINMDLRNIGIRFCKFTNTTFNKIVFPILDLPNNIGLLPIVESQNESIVFSLGYNGNVSLNEAKKLLLGLLTYYRESKQYFPIVNILLLNNKDEEAKSLIPTAMEHSITQHDFDSLQNLCQLIVNAGLFEPSQLRAFYNLIGDLIKPETFPYNLQKGYIVYIDNIKNILISNPNDYPCATINLSTTINGKNLNLLPSVIEDIEATIKSINPEITPCIQLTHHSPYDILVTLYGILPDLLLVCQTFYYAFGGIKSLLDIHKSKHEKINDCTPKTDNKDLIHQETISNIYFDLGPICFKKETKSVVKRMEYYIN